MLSEVELDDRGEVLVAAVRGEVDGSNAVELGRMLSERMPSSARGLVLDLRGLDYLDSAGIELLFSLGRRLADRRQRVRLVVADDSPMRRVLEISDIGTVAPIEADVEPAVAALREGTG